MSLVDLRREGAVFVLTMQAGENRFNRPFVDALNAALDEVEKSSGPAALVTTGSDKFYSNGLDLTWIMGPDNPEGGKFIGDVIRLLGRLLMLPVPTVAAINGHAFAGGAMLTLAHDFRVMRSDRGYFCLPEVDLKMPFAVGMNALIKTKLSGNTWRDAVLTGARYGGQECVQRGIVDEAVGLDEVLPRALARAAALAEKDRGAYAAIKRGLYGEVGDLMQRGELRAP